MRTEGARSKAATCACVLVVPQQAADERLSVVNNDAVYLCGIIAHSKCPHLSLTVIGFDAADATFYAADRSRSTWRTSSPGC